MKVYFQKKDTKSNIASLNSKKKLQKNNHYWQRLGNYDRIISKEITEDLELKRYHNEDDMSPIRFSCADEAIGEIKNLFFRDQLEEEQIMLRIFTKNEEHGTKVDLKRLNIDRVFSNRQLKRRSPFNRGKLTDASVYHYDYSVNTILGIKEEQKRLEVEFKNFMALITPSKRKANNQEPLLFAHLERDVYYLLNPEILEEYQPKAHSFKSILNWIKNRIFTKTSTQS